MLSTSNHYLCNAILSIQLREKQGVKRKILRKHHDNESHFHWRFQLYWRIAVSLEIWIKFQIKTTYIPLYHPVPCTSFEKQDAVCICCNFLADAHRPSFRIEILKKKNQTRALVIKPEQLPTFRSIDTLSRHSSMLWHQLGLLWNWIFRQWLQRKHRYTEFTCK